MFADIRYKYKLIHHLTLNLPGDLMYSCMLCNNNHISLEIFKYI